jgi:hypothetical protein
MKQINTSELDTIRADLYSDCQNLIDEIMEHDVNDPDDLEYYHKAVVELARWLGVRETDRLEFHGSTPWVKDDPLTLARDWGTTSEAEDLVELDDLSGEIGDWTRGVALIHEYSMDDYALELASESAPRDVDFNSWPYRAIDWGDAAKDLMSDMAYVTYQNETYYYHD